MFSQGHQKEQHQLRGIHFMVICLFLVSWLSAPFGCAFMTGQPQPSVTSQDAFSSLDSRFFCSSGPTNPQPSDQTHKQCKHCHLCGHSPSGHISPFTALTFFVAPAQSPQVQQSTSWYNNTQICPVSRGPPSQA